MLMHQIFKLGSLHYRTRQKRMLHEKLSTEPQCGAIVKLGSQEPHHPTLDPAPSTLLLNNLRTFRTSVSGTSIRYVHCHRRTSVPILMLDILPTSNVDSSHAQKVPPASLS